MLLVPFFFGTVIDAPCEGRFLCFVVKLWSALYLGQGSCLMLGLLTLPCIEIVGYALYPDL